MNIFNFEDWREQRAAMLHDEVLYMKHGESRRGEYKYREPCIINGFTREYIVPVNGQRLSSVLSRIIDAETLIMWNGTIRDPEIVQRCYENDDEMLNAYKSLQLHRLRDKNNSRNNVIHVADCCLCTWQFTGNTLFVHSRSMDVRAAGLSDPSVVNNIAKGLHADKWIIYVHQPHVYLDKTKIARRAK